MKKKKSGEVPALLLLEAIYIMLQIAVAVNYLHESWVTHCDFKVSNVLLNIVEDQNAYFSLKMRRTETRTQNHQVRIALQLFSLRYSMG